MSEEKNYPSLPEQGKNLAKFTWDVIKKAMTDGESLLVSDSTFQKRVEICKGCDRYDESQNRCIECGCMLEGKARFALDGCPLGKWSQDSDAWVSGKFDKLLNNLNNDYGIDVNNLNKDDQIEFNP